MKFGYTMDQVLRCGGVRVAFEHCRELIRQGHEAAIYANSHEPAIQDWIDRYGVKVLPLRALENGVDVLVSVWWRQMDELLQYPVRLKRFHLVQGRDALSYPEGHEWRQTIEAAMHRLDYQYLAVSPWAGASCRSPKIIPNGVDTEFWRPAPFTKLMAKFVILIEASTGDVYKGRDQAIAVAQYMKDLHDDVEVWLMGKSDALSTISTVDRYITDPSDMKILNAYQNASVLLKTSWFDGFGLPHLEAMACALPLVTTDAGGNMSFCTHDTNCLVAPVRAVPILQYEVQQLYQSKTLRERLVQGGMLTAKQWTWKKSIEKLLEAIE